MRTEVNFADAQQAFGFINPQQLRIQTGLLEVRYPSFDYARLLPVNQDGDMWDIGSMFFSGDIAGKAEFLSTRGFDMPFADISTQSFLRTNQLAGIGYEWSLGELRRAERSGVPLTDRKARAATRIAEAFCYNIAVRGHAEKGMAGLINYPGIPQAMLPVGAGGDTEWVGKTPDEILADINLTLNDVENNTKEGHIANTLLVATSKLQYMNGLRIGQGADTLRAFVQANNAYTLRTGQPLLIVGTRELETAGAGGSARMIAYDRDPDVVAFHLPGAHEFLPVFQKSMMSWEVGGIMNIGGTEVRFPKAMSYRDGN